MTAAIGRLDSICDLLHRMVTIGEEKNWPADLLNAAKQLAKDVTDRTGAIDSADVDSIDHLAAEANTSMPNDFAAFGKALARDLANSIE
jgi:hypothetical protein